MKGDVPPMDECSTTKSGRHEIMAITPGDDDGDLTFACQRCGAIRRIPARGAIAIPANEFVTIAQREN